MVGTFGLFVLCELHTYTFSIQVNYNYVKALAKKRIHIVNEVLEATLNYFPDEIDSHYFHKEIAQAIETFFLLDHCVEEENSSSSSSMLGHRRTRSLTNPFGKPNNEDQTKHKKGLSMPSVGDPFSESLEKVGHAFGSAVENVGGFLKGRLGDNNCVQTPVRKPPDIDTTFRSPVVPYTRKSRRSIFTRDQENKELSEIGEEANLLLDDERPQTELVPSYSHPLPTFGSSGSKLGDVLETNPLFFLGIFIVSALFLRFAAQVSVEMDLDILLLLIWASFCIGLHTPRPMVGGIDKSAAPAVPSPTPFGSRMLRKQDRHGRQLLRMSMAPTPDAAAAGNSTFDGNTSVRSTTTNIEDIREEHEVDSIMEVGQSPLPKFPAGAPLGSKLNCWSEPDYETFQVRGPNYLSYKVKEASGPFIFPIRAVDLFLTDTCPENAGR